MTRSDPLFRHCLAVSIALHAAILIFGGKLGRVELSSRLSPIKIDLSFPLTPKGRGTPRLGLPGRPPAAEALSPPSQVPLKEPVLVPTMKPLKPAKETTAVLSGTSSSESGQALPGGSPFGEASGTGTGVPGGSGMMMDRLPRLLNRDELSHSLRRFYPEKERRAGREGSVKVKLHIGIDGRVGRVEIMESKGKSFDKAAKSVAKRMRFSPAMFNGRLVAVRLRQTIIFRLED